MDSTLGPQTVRLNAEPLAAFKSIFGALDCPRDSNLRGFYHGGLTGPAWARRLASTALAMGKLGGWWGKEFKSGGKGINLVFSEEEGFRRVVSFRLVSMASAIDGKNCLAVQYTRSCPFPWPYIVDELRCLDEGCLLGLSHPAIHPLQRLAFPFLLYAAKDPTANFKPKSMDD